MWMQRDPRDGILYLQDPREGDPHVQGPREGDSHMQGPREGSPHSPQRQDYYSRDEGFYHQHPRQGFSRQRQDLGIYRSEYPREGFLQQQDEGGPYSEEEDEEGFPLKQQGSPQGLERNYVVPRTREVVHGVPGRRRFSDRNNTLSSGTVLNLSLIG